jgi:hypothetical protein
MKKKEIRNKPDNKKVIRLTLIISIILLLVFTNRSLQRLFILALFIIVNFFIAFSKRIIPTAFLKRYFYGVEAVLFCTVLTSFAFGSVTGAIMGCLLMAINYIAERRISKYFVATLVLYAIIGYISFYFKNYDIVIVGIIISIIYNLLIDLILIFLEPNKLTLVIFNIVNILFNIALFTSLGSIIYSFLA